MFKDANRSAYRKDSDQTDQSDLGLLFLIRSINDTKTLDDYGKCQWSGAQ